MPVACPIGERNQCLTGTHGQSEMTANLQCAPHYCSGMAVRRWTTHIQATVRGDLESVVSWWTSPERREERRAHYESLNVSDFRYEETLEDGQRITETGWTTRRSLTQTGWTPRPGLQLSLRMTSPIRPHGAVERTPDGRAVLRAQTVRSRRWPNGREDLSRSDLVLEFSELSESKTRVRLTVTQYKEGVSWLEKILPPNDERRHRRMHLKDTIAKCEYHLGTRKSPKRWLAVY